MGAFYGSVHLRTSDRDAVQKALTKIAKKKKARFLMGPVLHGWVAVYPDNSGQDDAMAKAIARGFSCEVLHVLVHDDDIFAYTFFRGGRLVDQYNSQPDYFDEVSARVRTKCRGRPELLADLVPHQRAVTELQEILNEARDAKVFATDSLDHFAKLLGLPNAVSSYEYLMEGETTNIDGWDQYVHVPDRSAEVARQEQADASVVQAKQKLQAAGLLLAEQSADHPAIIAAWCPDREGSGFLVAWINPVNGIGPVPIKHVAPPWTLPSNALRLVVSNNGNWLILSPSGRYLASGGSHGTQLWDVESSTLMHEHSSWTAPLFKMGKHHARKITTYGDRFYPA